MVAKMTSKKDLDRHLINIFNSTLLALKESNKLQHVDVQFLAKELMKRIIKN